MMLEATKARSFLNRLITLSPYRLVIATSLVAVSGCAHPNEDNIRLRKINQSLTVQVDRLSIQHASDKQTISGLIKRTSTIPTLPQEELQRLWVTGGITFGKLTGAIEPELGKKEVAGVMVFISTKDDNGQSIQAAGSFVVEAFDLAEARDNFLGRWTFDAGLAKSQWRSFLFEFGYELKCPWQKIPQHPDVTVRVTFTDELTHIPFTTEKLVHIDLGVSPVPVTIPAPTTTATR